MKKIVILSVIIFSTLVSCSTDDVPTFNQESNQSNQSKLSKSTEQDFCATCRDSIGRDLDTISIIDPVKPRRD